MKHITSRSWAFPISSGATAHLALRLVLGVNIATHGLVRITHPFAFAKGLSAGFQGLLPEPLVLGFGATLPFLELAIGLAIVFGVALRRTLFAGALLLASLTFGVCLQQKWETAGAQLIYALAYFALLYTLPDAAAAKPSSHPQV